MLDFLVALIVRKPTSTLGPPCGLLVVRVGLTRRVPYWSERVTATKTFELDSSIFMLNEISNYKADDDEANARSMHK